MRIQWLSTNKTKITTTDIRNDVGQKYGLKIDEDGIKALFHGICGS